MSSKRAKNIFGDPRLFPTSFFPKYFTGYISQCCVVSGNHDIYVHVIIPQANKWCKFPTYCCLKSACHIWVPNFFQGQTPFLSGLSFWPSSDELERSSSPGHGHFLYLLQQSFCLMDVNSRTKVLPHQNVFNYSIWLWCYTSWLSHVQVLDAFWRPRVFVSNRLLRVAKFYNWPQRPYILCFVEMISLPLIFLIFVTPVAYVSPTSQCPTVDEVIVNLGCDRSGIKGIVTKNTYIKNSFPWFLEAP